MRQLLVAELGLPILKDHLCYHSRKWSRNTTNCATLRRTNGLIPLYWLDFVRVRVQNSLKCAFRDHLRNGILGGKHINAHAHLAKNRERFVA